MVATITAALGRQLDLQMCRVYSSDLRVRVLATGLATYPDVTVICGPSERDPESATHVVNPKVVIEITRPSTAEYDRGERLEHYKTIRTLEAIAIVDHASERFDLWTRSGDGWQVCSFGSGETVPLHAIGVELQIDEIYTAARNA